MRRVATVAASVLLALLPAVAVASWSASSSGSGGAKARSVDAPSGITTVALSSSSVRLAWTAPSTGAPATSYVVSQSAPTVAAQVCTTASTTCDVTGLSPSTSYQFHVSSRVGNWASSAAAAPAVATPAAGTLTLSPVVAGTKTAGVAFDLTLASSPAITGTQSVAWSGVPNAPNGTAPVLPSTLVFDPSGQATASVTVYRAGTFTIGATVAGRTGSAALTVRAGSPASLAFGTSTDFNCSTGVKKGATSNVTMSAADAWSNVGPFASGLSISVARVSGDEGVLTPDPTSMTITADASPAVSTGTFQYKAAAGEKKDVRLRATSGGLSVDCSTKTT